MLSKMFHHNLIKKQTYLFQNTIFTVLQVDKTGPRWRKKKEIRSPRKEESFAPVTLVWDHTESLRKARSMIKESLLTCCAATDNIIPSPLKSYQLPQPSPPPPHAAFNKASMKCVKKNNQSIGLWNTKTMMMLINEVYISF